MHTHLMLMSPCETLYLNLRVQLVGSQCAHPGGVHGCKAHVTWIVRLCPIRLEGHNR
jgi:hypothetical protein